MRCPNPKTPTFAPILEASCYVQGGERLCLGPEGWVPDGSEQSSSLNPFLPQCPAAPLTSLVLPLPLWLVFEPVFTILGDLRVEMEGPGSIPSLLTGLVTELYTAVLCGIRWHVIPEIRLGHLPTNTGPHPGP